MPQSLIRLLIVVGCQNCDGVAIGDLHYVADEDVLGGDGKGQGR